jgi:hypothetical protein
MSFKIVLTSHLVTLLFSGLTYAQAAVPSCLSGGQELLINNEVSAGAQIEACGDYITSNAPSGHFPASPDGAIVHWVHQSPNPKSHDSGFIVVNGVVCGTSLNTGYVQLHH